MRTINLGTTAVPAVTERIQVLTDAPKIAVQCFATGAPTAIIVDVEGSLDGENFGVVESHTFTAGELTALNTYFYVTDKPVPYFRLNISTLALIAREITSITYAIANTGDGVLSAFSAVDSAPVETWTITCTIGGAGATFTVVGSISGAQVDATSAVAYNNSIVAFTITEGAAAWVAGDVITFDASIVGNITSIVRFD